MTVGSPVMNCPGPNSDPADGVDPVVVAHLADGVDPVDDPELPERVVVAVPADDLVSQARRDSSDAKLGIPRT